MVLEASREFCVAPVPGPFDHFRVILNSLLTQLLRLRPNNSHPTSGEDTGSRVQAPAAPHPHTAGVLPCDVLDILAPCCQRPQIDAGVEVGCRDDVGHFGFWGTRVHYLNYCWFQRSLS